MSALEIEHLQTDSIFKTLFDDIVISKMLPIQDYTESLYPGEANLIQRASLKRRLEFSTGRSCAKQALAKLGIKNFPVLRNKHRDPIWPAGIVGSISHCRDLCGVVVAKETDFRSIGFDIENIKPLDFDIAKHVCTRQEIDWLSQQPPSETQRLILLIFSLKESVFKCVYPQKKIQLGFKDCTITPNLEGHTASILMHRPDVLPALELTFMLTSQHIFSAAFYKSSFAD